jgi:hypothetical protein
VVGGWWLVVGGWWLVVGGWWLENRVKDFIVVKNKKRKEGLFSVVIDSLFLF